MIYRLKDLRPRHGIITPYDISACDQSINNSVYYSSWIRMFADASTEYRKTTLNVGPGNASLASRANDRPDVPC
jgi:hypothetical protein